MEKCNFFTQTQFSATKKFHKKARKWPYKLKILKNNKKKTFFFYVQIAWIPHIKLEIATKTDSKRNTIYLTYLLPEPETHSYWLIIQWKGILKLMTIITESAPPNFSSHLKKKKKKKTAQVLFRLYIYIFLFFFLKKRHTPGG